MGKRGRHGKAKRGKSNVDRGQGASNRIGKGQDRGQGMDTVRAEDGTLGMTEASAQGGGLQGCGQRGWKSK